MLGQETLNFRAPHPGNVTFLPLPQWPQSARDKLDVWLELDGRTSEARGQTSMLPGLGPWLTNTLVCSGCFCHPVVTTLLPWVSFPQEGTEHPGGCPFRTLASGFVFCEPPSTKAGLHL